MFCPECGKKNVENAQFCEHCGAKIAEEVKVNLPKKPRKPVNKKKVIIICILSLVVLILLIGGIILSDNYKPSKVAEDYFVALMNDDTDELYKYIDVDENEFTTKKIFEEVADNDKSSLVNYQVTSEEISEDGLTAQVKISYTLEGRQTPLVKTIYLVKNKKNKMLIFDNWKISDGSSLTVEDYKITVFKGASLKLEGVNVDKKYKDDSSDDDYDVYIIPTLFKGEYDIELTLENGLTALSKMDVSGYSSSINTFELSSKDEKSLESTVKEDIELLYNSAIALKSFEDIKSEFEYKDGDLSDLEDAYSSFARGIESSDLKSFELTDIEVSRMSITEDGYLKINVDMDYKYSVKKLFSDDIVSNSNDDLVYLTFDYKDGFKLIDMSSFVTYFSRY